MSASLRVLVVDDSPFVCRVLTDLLNAAPGVRVVGQALSGARAVELVRRLRPDVVTLDVEMPGTGGLAALEQMMDVAPVPVVLVSGVSRRAAAVTVEALERGAVDVLLKYTPGVDTDPVALGKQIIAKVRAAAHVRVVRTRRDGRPPAGDNPGAGNAPGPSRVAREWGNGPPADAAGAAVVIGASTGGPLAVRELLAVLPADFPAAVLVVQHLPASFTRAFAEHLGRQVALAVREAGANDPLRPELVLVAPGDYQLLLRPDGRVRLVPGRKVGGHCPAIDVTMTSAARLFGPRVAGVLLTGMGEDGVRGLAAIRAGGGETFAQSPAGCVVAGMPLRAIETGAVDASHVAAPAEIGRRLRVVQALMRRDDSWLARPPAPGRCG